MSSRVGGRGPRRVVVTAPPERAAPVVRGRRVPTLGPDVTERARALRRAQLRRAAVTLSCAAVLLFGLPVLVRIAPDLAAWRVAGLPLGWIAVAWLPYPLLGALAWWHLRRAERVERPAQIERPARPARPERAEPP